MSEKIGIIGSGGQASEAASYVGRDIVGFKAIDKEYIKEEDEIDILTPSEFQKVTPVISAIGAPAVRRSMVEKWPGEKYTVIVSEEAYVGDRVHIGEGTIIAPRAVITTEVSIGKHSLINVAATLSHGDKLGDFVTISPGAHIGGNVELSDGVFVGIGAIISNGLYIAEGTVVGAGAVVVDNIEEPNTVVVGIPAKKIRQNQGWLQSV